MISHRYVKENEGNFSNGMLPQWDTKINVGNDSIMELNDGNHRNNQEYHIIGKNIFKENEILLIKLIFYKQLIKCIKNKLILFYMS